MDAEDTVYKPIEILFSNPYIERQENWGEAGKEVHYEIEPQPFYIEKAIEYLQSKLNDDKTTT
jgi:hypothetical protein